MLRLFGAKIGNSVHVYPNARIWAPWNLLMGDNSCLADFVDCYCVAKISIGSNSIISQYSFLCSASHDYKDLAMPLIIAPIVVGNYVWVCSDVFLGPGVTLEDGVVITARSSVFNSMPSWIIASGFPAKIVKKRILNGKTN